GDTAQLMDMENFETFDLYIPEEIKNKIEPGREVIYLESLGKRKIERMA
ncbi:translation initiation factor 5A, partial [Archaeoglobales archaeon ex4484_92]